MNLSAMSALRMLSESRDGCDLLLDAEAIVGFVGCLSEMKRQPILLGEALFSLGNLTKLAESIKQAMAAGAVDRLMALLAEGEGTLADQLRTAPSYQGIAHRFAFDGGQVNGALFILAYRDAQAILVE